MRLTKVMKKKVVTAVMADMKEPVSKEELNETATEAVLAMMPTEVYIAYKAYPEWFGRMPLSLESTIESIELVYVPPFPQMDDLRYCWPKWPHKRIPDPITKKMNELMKQRRKHCHQSADLRGRLYSALEPISTVKQFRQAFPDLEKYLPQEALVGPLKNAPAVITDNRLISDLRALGVAV